MYDSFWISLQRDMGDAFVDRSVTEDEMLEAVRWLLGKPDRMRETARKLPAVRDKGGTG